jgi:hypothetical protein
MILMWSGSIATIPAGFALCDGTGGTPDLRDQFVVGAGTTYNPGDSGGNVNHQHGFNDGGHAHVMQAGSGVSFGGDYSTTTGSTAAAGITADADGRPPYYSLAYIMKT